ncbi:MAG: hypothetical protein HKM24_07245, partial [Gammaproteobacteria bacterium]|nr:hypothetical protein [Gammaproteobacteria bacterium]
ATMYLSMRVEVLEVLKGKYSGKFIEIEGDNGMLCRASVSQFPIGTEWIMAVPAQTKQSFFGLLESIVYTAGICGEYNLPVEENNISGRIVAQENTNSDKIQVLSLARLRELLALIVR